MSGFRKDPSRRFKMQPESVSPSFHSTTQLDYYDSPRNLLNAKSCYLGILFFGLWFSLKEISHWAAPALMESFTPKDVLSTLVFASIGMLIGAAVFAMQIIALIPTHYITLFLFSLLLAFLQIGEQWLAVSLATRQLQESDHFADLMRCLPGFLFCVQLPVVLIRRIFGIQLDVPYFKPTRPDFSIWEIMSLTAIAALALVFIRMVDGSEAVWSYLVLGGVFSIISLAVFGLVVGPLAGVRSMDMLLLVVATWAVIAPLLFFLVPCFIDAIEFGIVRIYWEMFFASFMGIGLVLAFALPSLGMYFLGLRLSRIERNLSHPTDSFQPEINWGE